MDYPIKVTLNRPVTHDGETYAVLLFDEPDLGMQVDYSEMEATFDTPPSPKDAARVNLFWMSRLAGVPEAVMRKVKACDIDRLNAAVEAIMGVEKPDAGAAEGDAGNVPQAA